MIALLHEQQLGEYGLPPPTSALESESGIVTLAWALHTPRLAGSLRLGQDALQVIAVEECWEDLHRPTAMSIVFEATMAKGGTPALAPASCSASSVNWYATCRLAFLLACARIMSLNAAQCGSYQGMHVRRPPERQAGQACWHTILCIRLSGVAFSVACNR